MVRVGRRKEFPYHGQRTRPASTRVRAARRIAADRQCRAPLLEVSRVLGVGSDLPPSDETNPIGMNNPTEALAVRPPAQVGAGIHRARRGVAKMLTGNSG